MSRYCVDPLDAGYLLFKRVQDCGCFLAVYLDDERVADVCMADEEGRILRRLLRPFRLNPRTGEPERESLRGEVRVELEFPAQGFSTQEVCRAFGVEP